MVQQYMPEKKSKKGLFKKKINDLLVLGVPVLIKKIKVFIQKKLGATFVL